MKKLLPIWILTFTFCFSLYSFDQNLPWIKNGKDGMEVDIVKPFLPEKPNVLEAGGHYGEDTVVLARKWPQSTIYTFEPCPAYYKKLKKTTEGYSNIHAYNFGLFTTTGHYTFHVSKNWDGASSLLEDNHLPVTVYNDYQISVFCKNLDEWANESKVDHIDYMWLDMEGAELYVLKSAPNILSTVRAISCEVNYKEFRKGMPQFKELHEFLIQNGFTIYKIWSRLQGSEPESWQSTAVYIRSTLL